MEPNKPTIYVTQPNLPDLQEYMPFLQQIWESKTLTNNGPLHNQLERALCDYLGLDHLVLFNNGTIALLAALKALGIRGEVITTPFTFPATAHVISWSGLTPVFADIDPCTLNLAPESVEAAITEKTTAIMPVHCFGNPCDTAAFSALADRYNLNIIYDAAHAFGVQDDQGAIARHGDLAVLSFHATKTFSTLEGGAIVCRNPEMYDLLSRLKNFGIVNELTISDVGINGKMNEVCAAFGLMQLRHMDNMLRRRSEIDYVYRRAFSGMQGIGCMEKRASVPNYGYFPILVGDEFPYTRDEVCDALRGDGIYARRYFYPLLANLPMYRHFSSAGRDNLPVANSAAERILCLPIYAGLTDADQQRVIRIIQQLGEG